MSKRYQVTEISGVASRNTGSLIGRRESRTELAESTLRRRISELRKWSNSIYDGFGDTGDSDILRVVTASHYVTGVENVRILRIRPVR